MVIKSQIKNILEKAVKTLGYDESVTVSFSTQDNADFQSSIAFSLAKKTHQNPMVLAQQIVSEINEISGIEVFVSSPAFINFKLSNSLLSNLAEDMINSDTLGVEKTTNPEFVILDYGGANVAKELHMGHLRSPIIGESMKRLYSFFGNEVVADTHLGDWGLQMGLTIAQLKDEGVLDYYFKGVGSKPEITLDMLNDAYPKASSRSKVDADFKQIADDFTLMLQQKKQPYYMIWQEIRSASVKKIEKNYETLGAKFDLWYGESTASPFIEETINAFKSQGLCRESEGALVVDIARDGEHIPLPKKSPDEKQMYKNPMPPAVIQKSNGGELYVTTDLATIVERVRDFPRVTKIIYITDARQNTHFEQVFRCARKAQLLPDNVELLHIGYGTMNGKDGKPFKTRAGGSIKLEDVINMLREKAQEKLTQNNLEKDDKLAISIGVSAMKFGDLSNQVGKDYVLDLDKFTAFEGKTGPYLQYTATRIKSLLAKANTNGGKINIERTEERDIIIAINKFLDSLEQALIDNTLNGICLSLYNVASSFSVFYNNIHVISETDVTKKQSYISLCELVLKTLTLGLNILAIDIPDRM